jgi:hypothetical protein
MLVKHKKKSIHNCKTQYIKINKSIISGAFSFASRFHKCKNYMQKYNNISQKKLISKALYMASPSE